MNNPTLPPPLIGWPLLPQPDDDGRLHYPNLETSVRQAIRVILSTRPGEQLMHPTFGAGLSDFLNEPNTLTTRRRIRDQVTETLGFWEPRIVLERVDVQEVADHPDHIRLEIGFRLRRNGLSQQIGITIQLEG